MGGFFLYKDHRVEKHITNFQVETCSEETTGTRNVPEYFHNIVGESEEQMAVTLFRVEISDSCLLLRGSSVGMYIQSSFAVTSLIPSLAETVISQRNNP